MSVQWDSPLRMQIRSQPWQLCVVRAAVERLCCQIGLEDKEAHNVVLSLDEALSNIIRHAYAGLADRPIDIEFCTGRSVPDTPDRLRVRVRDYGRRVAPEQIRSRDLDDIRPGGLGVHIIQTCMDRVEYRPAEGEGTELTMIKEIASGKGAGDE